MRGSFLAEVEVEIFTSGLINILDLNVFYVFKNTLDYEILYVCEECKYLHFENILDLTVDYVIQPNLRRKSQPQPLVKQTHFHATF